MLTTNKGSLKLTDFRHAAERRREIRRPLKRMIQYLPCDRSDTTDYEIAQVMDVSSQGISMRTRQKLHKGTCFHVKLKSEETIMLIYVVRHCRRDLDGRYTVGGELEGTIGSFKEEDPEWIYHMLEAAESLDELN